MRILELTLSKKEDSPLNKSFGNMKNEVFIPHNEKEGKFKRSSRRLIESTDAVYPLYKEMRQSKRHIY